MLASIRSSRPVQAILGNSRDATIEGSSERDPLINRNSARERKLATPLPTSACNLPLTLLSRWILTSRTTTAQVLVLCLMRFGEPIAFTVIFPFVARFLEDLHVTDDPSKIGYFAGRHCCCSRWGRTIGLTFFRSIAYRHHRISFRLDDFCDSAGLGSSLRSDRRVLRITPSIVVPKLTCPSSCGRS
jgi:hypothetical protein